MYDPELEIDHSDYLEAAEMAAEQGFLIISVKGRAVEKDAGSCAVILERMETAFPSLKIERIK